MKTTYSQIKPFITLDGSEIRELMHPHVHGNRQQSLADTANAPSLARGPRLISVAEAVVAPGKSTQPHRHQATEEIYHFVAGSGRMQLGEQEFVVAAGDTVCVPPGTAHCLHNTGQEPLRLLCSCAPPYSDTDTELL